MSGRSSVVDDWEFIMKPKGDRYWPLWTTSTWCMGGTGWRPKTSRSIFLPLIGFQITTLHFCALSPHSLTIWALGLAFFPDSRHHLESFPHQGDNPFIIWNPSPETYSRFRLHSSSTAQCLDYTLDLVTTSHGISYFFHGVITSPAIVLKFTLQTQ